MKIKILSFFVIIVTLAASTPFALAGEGRQTGDWNALRNHMNAEIAVKTESGKTVFGVLRTVENDSLKIQVVNRRSNYETLLTRREVEKVWRAELRGGGNVAKGALVGAGIGAVAGLIAGATAKERDPLNYAGVFLFGILGAGAGALIGGASKNVGKKKNLIYKA